MGVNGKLVMVPLNVLYVPIVIGKLVMVPLTVLHVPLVISTVCDNGETPAVVYVHGRSNETVKRALPCYKLSTFFQWVFKKKSLTIKSSVRFIRHMN